MARINGGSIAISKWLIALWRYSWFIRGQNIYVNTSGRQKRIVSWNKGSTVTSSESRKCGIFSMRRQNYSFPLGFCRTEPIARDARIVAGRLTGNRNRTIVRLFSWSSGAPGGKLGGGDGTRTRGLLRDRQAF